MSVISFINMKGGVGKTTLAVNVAHCLASRKGKKVLLIDIDPQFNATQCVMSPTDYIEYVKGENNDTITSVFDQDVRVKASVSNGPVEEKPKTLVDIEVLAVSDGLYVLPGALELHRIEIVAGDGRENRLRQFLSAMKEAKGFDYIIIDTPPTPSIWMTSALIASDYYLIPTKPDPISFTGIELLQSIINRKKENLDLKIKCIGIVLNMVESTTVIYKEADRELRNGKWKKFRYSSWIPKRTSVAKEQLSNKFILDLDITDLKKGLVNVVSELEDRIQNDK